jgi:hypothetical protein
MDKIAITQYATSDYNRQSYNNVLTAVQTQINRAADGYLFPVKRLTSADSPYSATYNDSVLIVDATSGAVTINLKPAKEWEQKRIVIKKIDASANAVTAEPDASETIDGASSKSVNTQWASFELASEGGEIFVI